MCDDALQIGLIAKWETALKYPTVGGWLNKLSRNNMEHEKSSFREY